MLRSQVAPSSVTPPVLLSYCAISAGSPTSFPVSGLPPFRTLNLPSFTLTNQVQLPGDRAEVLVAEVERLAQESGAVVGTALADAVDERLTVGFLPAACRPMIIMSHDDVAGVVAVVGHAGEPGVLLEVGLELLDRRSAELDRPVRR